MWFYAEKVEEGRRVGGVEEGFQRVALRDDGVGQVCAAGQFGVESWCCGVEGYGGLRGGVVVAAGFVGRMLLLLLERCRVICFRFRGDVGGGCVSER